MSNLRDVHLLFEMEDGLIYQVLLTDKQRSAIRSILALVGGEIKILDEPLSTLSIERKEPNAKS